MVKLRDLFKKRGTDYPSVLSVLNRISRENLLVRMELEQTLIRFQTVLSVKWGSVVIGKPRGLEDEIRKGRLVRFKLPWEQRREIRMEIVTPHFNLSNGTHVFLCKLPTGYVTASHRASERFNTNRFRNLHLTVPRLGDQFRILDLSSSGCRIETGPARRQRPFRLHNRIGESAIQLGKKVQIELDYVIPRVLQKKAVGLEFNVRPDGTHHRSLTTILTTLEMIDVRQIDTQPV